LCYDADEIQIETQSASYCNEYVSSFAEPSENLTGLLTFGIGNTTEVFYFPGNLELTKIWLKIWVSTGRTTGKMNEKGINTSGIRLDERNSGLYLHNLYGRS
jgi:hypothetical protein